MFNNPFDSFHNTVAEAKEEREQLDRLLTISTPRERLLVAAAALVLIVLAGWLFLGSVARHHAVDGVLVGPGTETLGEGRSLQALVWIPSEVASEITAGMPASVELVMANGEGALLDGTVARIAAVALSEAAAIESVAPVSAHRIDIALDESPDSTSLAGGECRIVIGLGRQTPIAYFGIGRSLDGAGR